LRFGENAAEAVEAPNESGKPVQEKKRVEELKMDACTVRQPFSNNWQALPGLSPLSLSSPHVGDLGCKSYELLLKNKMWTMSKSKEIGPG